ncbi:MAG: glutamate-5-semialdehyde dehydrogenase, partial [Lentisphaerae bacterium]|nr:glutamate-5-semialdehyde dehydrogenase [Lentisphaerota bacterium]
MNVHDTMVEIGDRAVAAAREMVPLHSRKKNAILESMATEIEARVPALREANGRDIEEGREAGLSDAMLDRLLLTDSRVEGMITGLRTVAGLKDPIGARLSRWIRPNGLEIVKRRVPIGVIAIIYESRPNVTADTAALCFKTSNAVILRGGKEAIHSNAAIADALIEGGAKKGMPEHAVQLVRTTDRQAVRELIQLEDRVDMVIPRGGEALIRAVMEHARVPVLKHYKGVCHTYVDASAQEQMALDIMENAKCQRPGVCNAMETLLVDAAVAGEFLPPLARLLAGEGVELRCCETSRRLLAA